MATRTIGTELVLTGEKSFNDGMKAVNSNLKNMRADMARVTAEFDGNADSINALTAKQKVLQGSVEQHRAKVDALQRMYDEQKKRYGENSAAADKYRLQLTQATTALLKEENQLRKTAKAIKQKAKADEEAEKAARERAEAERKLAEEQERTRKEEEKAAKEALKSEARHERLERRKERLAKAANVLGDATKLAAAGVAALGAASAAAVLGMVNMAKESAEAAKAAAEAGEELTEAQQRWLDFSTQLDGLSGSAANAKSAIAGILLPVLGELATEGTDFLNSFTADMSAAAGDTEKQTEILARYIADGAKLILKKLPEYIQSGKKLLAGFGAGFSEAAPELFDMAEDLLREFLNFVITKAPDMAEGGLEMVLQLIEGIDGEDMADTASNLVGRLVSMLAEYAPKLIPAAVNLIGEFVIGLAKNAPMLLKSGWDLLMSVIDGLLSAKSELPRVWRELVNVLITAMRSSDSQILQFGADVVEWIADGIMKAWDGLVSWFNGLWDNLFSGRDVDVNVNASGSAAIDGSHASGLRYVPFDGYLAQLHRGEAVLPAEEAAAYRAGNAGGKVFNLTINAKSVSKEDLDMLVEYMNGKLGDGL